MRKGNFFRIVLSFSLLCSAFIFYCGNDDRNNPLGPTNDTSVYSCENVEISLSIPSGAEIDPNDLRVISFSDEVPIGKGCDANVSMPETDECQLVFVVSEETGAPVFLGLRDPSIYSFTISSTSTALSLLMLNPFLIGADKTIQDEYISAALLNPKFDDLLTSVESAYKELGVSALDYDTNPSIYRLSLELMTDLSKSLGLDMPYNTDDCPSPCVVKGNDNTITFVNPTCVWYGAGIYYEGESLKEVVTIPRIDDTLTGNMQDTKTDYVLESGYNEIFLTKGCEFSSLTDWDDSKGRATALNTAQAIVSIIETGTGNIVHFDEALAKTFADIIKVSESDITGMEESFAGGDVWALFSALVEMTEHDKRGIARWLWKQNDTDISSKSVDAAELYIGCLSETYRDFLPLFDTAGWAGQQVPFLRDLLTAPEEVTYYLTIEDSDITSWEQKFTASGRVIENGSGLPGVSVHIAGENTDRTVVTDSDGNFSFRLLDTGLYTFAITINGYRMSYSIFKVEIKHSDIQLPDILATQTGDTNGGGTHDIHGITFVSIPGGSFQMGDVEGNGKPDELPVHFVTLDAFEMSECEITYGQYGDYLNAALESGDITVSGTGVIGNSGKYVNKIYMALTDVVLVDSFSGTVVNNESIIFPSEILNHPVTNVTWFGAKAFAQYYGFDLPTEAEWEYAARGGKQNEYGTNDGTLSMDNAAINLSGYHIEIPEDVGCFPPNPFGLYDMCCGVMEWCDDGYDSEFYSRSPSVNPRGAGSFKVVRDGNGSNTEDCRASARHYEKSTTCYGWIGFRVVRKPQTE